MFLLLSLFWLIRETKAILFWLYLWQLKEYHIGRFRDHFNTQKGKQLLFNKIAFLKIILIFWFLFLVFIIPNFGIRLLQIANEFWAPIFFLSFGLGFFIYVVESLRTLENFIGDEFKRPVFTKKIAFLFFICQLSEFLFIFVVYKNPHTIPLFDGLNYFFLWSFDLLINNYLPPLIWLVAFDILTPLIVSAVVLIFQPFAVFGRNRIIGRAKLKREQFKNILVVGITGSYGKTSTKEFLATILEEKFPGKVLKTKAHQNSEAGISQCILNDLMPEHEIFVCEMGAYNRGGIKLLCGIAKPKIGVLTGINEQHMATFGSQDNIVKAKFELIESLPENGVAFFNERNKHCLDLYRKTNIRKILYGKEARFFGEENILGAIAVAKELGMTGEEIGKSAAKIKNRFGGIEQKETANGIKIFDATYSANPDGVIAHLEYLKNFPGKKIIIMPCLIELGRASREVHGRIGRKIGEVCDLAIMTSNDRLREIKEAAYARASARQKAVEILFMENPNEIFEKIKTYAKAGDIALLESRIPSVLIKKLLNETF